MTLNLTIPQQMHSDFTPRITVIGVGGGGTNAVDNMIAMNLQGVDFVVANTDAQQLMHSKADRRIQLGPHLTQGLGAGAKPAVGRAAAEEAADELYRHLEGAHMIFITAGMGGGTGTGAAPVIARMAREKNILTVGVVTKPFTFEGGKRARAAEEGIAELQQFVDTLIVIPNQNLFLRATQNTSFKDAFKMADEVLYMGVRGVTDLMTAPSLVNLDFADIRTVMAEMGKAMMGTGEASGEDRAINAALQAINNPLLENNTMRGARGLLINITGGEDMTLFEVDAAANRIRDEVDGEANIIFGASADPSMEGRIRVSVVATGIESAVPLQQTAPKLVAVGGGAPAPVSAIGGQPAPGALSPGLSVVGGGQPTSLRPGAPPFVAAPPPRGFAQPASGATAQAIVTPPTRLPFQAQPPVAPRDPEPVLEAEALRPQPVPMPVIDEAPLPPRQIPEHLARPQAPRPVQAPPRGLFTAETAPEAPVPGRARSLFGRVTGAFRTPAPAAMPVRQEPVQQQAYEQTAEPAEAAPAAETTSKSDLEIPAFLRRQVSTPKQ